MIEASKTATIHRILVVAAALVCMDSSAQGLNQADVSAVIAAIELGGDTDTVAAVTGGLAGAIYGVQAIPSRWTTYLHGHVTTTDGRRTYRGTDLQHLTLRLLGSDPAPEQQPDQRRGPTEIAPGGEGQQSANS